MIAFFFYVAGAAHGYAPVAAWIGFMLAAYSAIANDSIQTLGTFLASNKDKKWWKLWLFIGSIFIVTVSYSWVLYGGDVSYERLSSKGFEVTPTSFSFLQIAAPIFLLILTRLKMPVSTTFLLLTTFATSSSSIIKVLSKSLTGYVLAFSIAICVWLLVSKHVNNLLKKSPSKWWTPVQWGTTGFLWSIWLMQDVSNIAVYLPRSMGTYELLGFISVVFIGLGILFYKRGEKVQEVVEEKSKILDVRAATLIDFIYSIILLYFKMSSKIPMSTTWVFIGLLSGREIAMSLTNTGHRDIKQTLKLVSKDLLFVTIGLVISLMMAYAVNMELTW